jgi:hypothetical protein
MKTLYMKMGPEMPACRFISEYCGSTTLHSENMLLSDSQSHTSIYIQCIYFTLVIRNKKTDT